MERERIKKIISQGSVKMIGVSYVDLAGISRMKPMISSEIDSILDHGIKTGRANLALNTLAMTPNSAADVSQGDLSIVPDPGTFVVPSYSPETGRFLGELYEKDGTSSALCTRSVLRRLLETTKSRHDGIHARVGFESEFHVVNKQVNGTILPVDQASTHSQDGYNIHRLLISEFVDALRTVNVQPVKAHMEGGRSQLEIDVAHEDALRAADNFVYFKDTIRTVARQRGLLATFMPKIGHEWWGSGLHLHISLWDSAENNLFSVRDGKQDLGISSLCYHFIAGLLKHMEGLCTVCAPTVNSYKRILPGRWNADAIMFGPGSRGAAIRIPDERSRATRIECRFPDAACNPYLAIACILAAGLDGVEKGLDPPEAIKYDISSMTDTELRGKGLRLMPRSLHEALSAFRDDDLLRTTLGDTLFEELIRAKEYEISQASDKVTQWEIDHFLDIF